MADTSPGENVRVVLAHGLWMTGLESSVLRQRLNLKFDFDTRQFSYNSVRSDIGENADRLYGFIQDVDGDIIHLVGHSLGGLVILNMLDRYPDLRPGRIVCLGTPFLGCQSAEGLARWGFGVRLMGETTVGDLLGHGTSEWNGDRDVGVIAGTRGIGLGHFFTRLNQPHDGTVSVSETRLPGATDHVILPVSHTGMLFSQRVATLIAGFLNHGRFPETY